jgi:hypothetical protein
MQEKDEFSDQLGTVTISLTHIERDRSGEQWEDIEEIYSSKDILDKIHYSKIEDIDFQPESRYPLIMIETDSGWRKMPFEEPEQAKKVFRRFRYRYQAYLQNH